MGKIGFHERGSECKDLKAMVAEDPKFLRSNFLAKESHRGRMLSVYTLAFMTSGPIGAIISGNIIENYGLRANILTSSLVGITFLTILSIKTNIWKIKSPE